MKITSLGFQTNLMLTKHYGQITDCGSYTLVQTPSNPDYHWGNYIIFDRPPQKGDLKEWTKLFDEKFTYYNDPHHYTFAWESNEQADYQEFIGVGFESDSAIVLTADKINPPPFINNEIEIRKVSSDKDWHEIIELQVMCADPKYLNAYYREFKKKQIMQYREMSLAGCGNWFGAYFNTQLVGDLGIFHNGKLGRYQSVGTHPNFRRKGICGTLVYRAGLIALGEYGVNQLVMEADPEYHAARIYESVGFKRSEVNYSLSWWKR